MNATEPQQSPQDKRWDAVVLAAGAGERLGGVAKALIRIDGQTLIARVLDALVATGANEIVVVLGHQAEAIAGALNDRPGLRVLRLAPPASQADSLRHGLSALRPDSKNAMICLADQPHIDTPALTALRDAYLQRPAGMDMVVPWVGDTPGNPVMISRTVIDALCAAGPAKTGKVWREHHPERVLGWRSNNPAYVTDLDTPADVERLRADARQVDLPSRAGLDIEPRFDANPVRR